MVDFLVIFKFLVIFLPASKMVEVGWLCTFLRPFCLQNMWGVVIRLEFKWDMVAYMPLLPTLFRQRQVDL